MQLRREVQLAVHNALSKRLGKEARLAIQNQVVSALAGDRYQYLTPDGTVGEVQVGGLPHVADADVRQMVDEELKAIDALVRARLKEGGQPA